MNLEGFNYILQQTESKSAQNRRYSLPKVAPSQYAGPVVRNCLQPTNNPRSPV